MSKIIVVGGGPAGMFAAIHAAERGHEVLLLEKNEKLGKKLYITGKGRCNLTNAGDMDTLFANVMTNSKFLYSAFYACDNHQVINFFEKNGMKTKIERGNRVFPESDHSSDVIVTLQKALKEKNVTVMLHTKVDALLTESWNEMNLSEIQPENGSFELKKVQDKWANKKKKQECSSKVIGVRLENGRNMLADALILATGGFSYQTTGSTGDGYRFAGEVGHSITDIQPSLVPFYTKEPYVTEMQGLSLKNVSIRINDGKKLLYEEFGEMLFTHFGVSGPLVLSASAAIKPKLLANTCSMKQEFYMQKGLPLEKGYDLSKGFSLDKELSMEIDLKPALTEEQLDLRLLREFEEAKNKQFKNSITTLFPSKMIPVMLKLSCIDPEKKVNEITREERQDFVRLMKSFPVTLCGLRDFNEAIITRGGIKVKEVNPSTMESKLVKNLFFCGELLDLDAMTGGYNLQIAWSTAYLAGTSV